MYIFSVYSFTIDFYEDVTLGKLKCTANWK